MTKTQYQPVTHDHIAFIKKSAVRPGFTQAYEALAPAYKRTRQELVSHIKQQQHLRTSKP